MGAPFHTHLEGVPTGGTVWRESAADGTGIRLGRWTAGGGAGTILLLPGRTEYIEKYGAVIAEFTGRGYGVVTLDWRGQGLSDRVPEANLGHVGRFAEFQQDLALALRVLAGMPKPHVMVAHSMGGCIGLRGLIAGVPVERAVFSAPMWGLSLAPHLSLIAPFLARFLRALGRSQKPVPGGTPRNYVEANGFRDNTLTTDAAMFERMRAHLEAEPALGLGSPTVAWLGAAFDEMEELLEAPPPALPILVGLGSDERVVSPAAIMTHAEQMPDARIVRIAGARHELFFEAPKLAQPFWDEIDAFLAAR